MASIYSIVYKPEDEERGTLATGRYLRVPLQRANLVAGHGIEGDRKGGGNPTRQLNIVSLEWLATQQAKGYKTDPGQFGEQIIVSGVAVESLEPGTRLQLGEEACIEITQHRKGCEKLVAAQGKTIEGLGPLGAMAKVITSGAVAVGDEVAVIEPSMSVGVAEAVEV